MMNISIQPQPPPPPSASSSSRQSVSNNYQSPLISESDGLCSKHESGYQIEFHDQDDEEEIVEDELVSLIESDSSKSRLGSVKKADGKVNSVDIDPEEDSEEVASEQIEEDNETSTENSSPMIEESPPLISSTEPENAENDGDEDDDGNNGNQGIVPPLITPKMEGLSWSKIIFARNNVNSASVNNNKDSECSSSPASFTEWNRRKAASKDCPYVESETMTLKREGNDKD